MKYTNQEFKFDHPFDFVRYFFSGLIFAPFRFTNEITRKLPYLSKDKLIKVNVWAIAINALLIIVDLGKRFLDKNWNPLRGKIPLVTYLVSLAFLGFLLYLVTKLNQPNFKVVAKGNKSNSENKQHTCNNVYKHKENVVEKEELDISEKGTNNMSQIISDIMPKELNLDVDDLKCEMVDSNFEGACEIPVDLSSQKIKDAIETDKFNVKESGLDSVDHDCTPNIEDLNFDVSDANSLSINLSDILEGQDTSSNSDSDTMSDEIDWSSLNNREFSL